MLYYEFSCNFTANMKKVLKKRGFLKESGEVDFNKLNNYYDMLLNDNENMDLRFYDLENDGIKGLFKINFNEICRNKPEAILKTELTKIFCTSDLNINFIKEIKLETYLKRFQWGKSLVAVRFPNSGKLVNIENSYLSSFSCGISERLIKKTAYNENEIMDKVRKLLIDLKFENEIKRIYRTGILKNFYGHPVHYLINNENKERIDNIIECLTETLYVNERIKSSRIIFVNDLYIPSFEYDEYNFEELLEDNEGGTVVIAFYKNDNEEEQNRNSDYFKSLKMFWNMVVRYKNKIQFIFVDIPDDIIFDRQSKNSICLTTLSDGVISGKNAKIYIRNKISEFGFENYENTFNYDKILDDGEYSIFKIDELINLWHDNILKKEIFRLYN